MNDPTMRVFLNERGLTVPKDSSVLTVVRHADPALADQLAVGDAVCTDGRGVPCAPEDLLTAGSILRVRVSARRPGQDPDADA